MRVLATEPRSSTSAVGDLPAEPSPLQPKLSLFVLLAQSGYSESPSLPNRPGSSSRFLEVSTSQHPHDISVRAQYLDRWSQMPNEISGQHFVIHYSRFPRRNFLTNVGKVRSPQDTPVMGLSRALSPQHRQPPSSGVRRNPVHQAPSYAIHKLRKGRRGTARGSTQRHRCSAPPTLSSGLPYEWAQRA